MITPQRLQILRRIVPADPHHIDAELAEMICIQQLILANPQGSYSQWTSVIKVFADDISKQTTPPTPMAARAILIAAEISQAVHTPAETLQRLQALPACCHGLSDEKSFLDRGAELQIAAWIELGYPMQAVQVLAATHDPINAPIASLVKQLDAAFDTAQVARNAHQALLIANARVTLASLLVNHAIDAHSAELDKG